MTRVLYFPFATYVETLIFFYPREDAGGLSRENVLRIPSVS